MKLRAHHLVCLQFFRGEGYTKEYVENLFKIVGMLEKGEKAEIVMGPDDVCVACPFLENDICKFSENSEAEVTELDQMAMNLLKIKPGDEVRWGEVKGKMEGVMKVWKKYSCNNCHYFDVCSKDEFWKSF
jgi:hypothetical protein